MSSRRRLILGLALAPLLALAACGRRGAPRLPEEDDRGGEGGGGY